MEFHTYETVPNAFHPNETHLPSFILIATPRHLFCLCDTSFNANETPTETGLIKLITCPRNNSRDELTRIIKP